MRRGARWFVVAFASLSACGPRYGAADNPTRVTDSTGATFGWTCNDEQCDAVALPQSPPPPTCATDERASFGYFWGRFLTVCGACAFPSGGWGTSAAQCRPLVCTTSRDCPLIYQFDPVAIYECVDGLCQNADTSRHPREPLSQSDVTTLCYATHDRAETPTPLAPQSRAIDALVASSCPGAHAADPCPLPPECLQP